MLMDCEIVTFWTQVKAHKSQTFRIKRPESHLLMPGNAVCSIVERIVLEVRITRLKINKCSSWH